MFKKLKKKNIFVINLFNTVKYVNIYKQAAFTYKLVSISDYTDKVSICLADPHSFNSFTFLKVRKIVPACIRVWFMDVNNIS